MNAGAIVQARLGSTRLPGKVLADLGGRPILGRVVDRLRLARAFAFVGVATTTDAGDDAVAAWCAQENVPCFRGPVDDVLHRYVAAAQAWRIDPIVRITADCPFVCPLAIDTLVPALVAANADYAGYDGPRLGEGIDPFSLRVLAHFDALPIPADEREHLALLVRRHRESIACVWVPPEPGLEAIPGARLSVDEPADLAFARELQRALPRDFTSYDLATLLARRPELADHNRHVVRTVPSGVR